MRLLFLILFAFAQAQFVKAFDFTSAPKYEVRAVWLATIGGLDWPKNYANNNTSIEQQKQELRTILDKLQRANINTVLFQTRIRGTVVYPSNFEPYDGCLSGVPGKSPGYDALQFAIDECHKRGMEIQAWIVTIPVGKWNSLGCSRLRKAYPGLIKKIGDEGYMNPENSKTAHLIANICEEITRNYDIDGIHLDYIRYPETWKTNISKSAARDNITRIVSTIHNRIKAIKPYVKMSCSPIGKFNNLARYNSNGWNSYTRVMQDAQGWLNKGLMDELFPMLYFKENQFYPFAIDWAEQSNGRIIALGLATYMMSPDEKNWDLSVVAREMNVSRQYEMGYSHFRSSFFTDNTKGIYDFTINDFNPYLALIPPMKWANSESPTPPISFLFNGQKLSWKDAKTDVKPNTMLYNLYSSNDYPVNTNDAKNLIITRIHNNSIMLPLQDINKFYAITSLDRYGNESVPLQVGNGLMLNADTQLLKCDNNKLILPNQNIKYVEIRTLQNTVIATKDCVNKTVDITDIPAGLYSVYSINQDNKPHFIGQFASINTTNDAQ